MQLGPSTDILVGTDGRTPHYRLHGKHFIANVLEFCEIVYAKALEMASRKRSLKAKAVLGIEPRTQKIRWHFLTEDQL